MLLDELAFNMPLFVNPTYRPSAFVTVILRLLTLSVSSVGVMSEVLPSITTLPAVISPPRVTVIEAVGWIHKKPQP